MKTKLLSAFMLFLLLVFACKKETNTPDPEPPPPTPVDTVPEIKPPTDPGIAATMGFFLNDWEPKQFTKPSQPVSFAAETKATTATINIDRSEVLTKIPKSMSGANSNIWMTQIVTETALMNHINHLKPHLIRFPGGSLSDKYFWNANKDQPPADAPDKLIQANGSEADAGYWYGKNSESWTLSVDNFYNLLQQTGNSGMITINYGYARYGTSADPVAAAAHLAADWVRYDNGRTKYWEIGNENFGDWEAGYRINMTENKDGQPELVTGNLYGSHFKVFADSMKKAALEVGATIYIGAVLYDTEPASWTYASIKSWNQGVLSASGTSPDFYIVHSYFTPYNENSTVDQVLNTPQPVISDIMNYMNKSFTSTGVNPKPVILNEWNIFSRGSKQAVSNINGLHAVMVLGETLTKKFGMTSRWDLANGWENGDDHGMFNIGDEPGVPKWNPRPAFYYIYFMQKMLGDRLVSSQSSNPAVVSYASSFTSGEMGVALVNKSAQEQIAEVKIKNYLPGSQFYSYTLRGAADNNGFSLKTYVNETAPNYTSGGPIEYAQIKPRFTSFQDVIKVAVPARGSVFMVIDKK